MDSAAPPGGNGIGVDGCRTGNGMGGGATFTGVGAQAATELITIMAARLLTPRRMCFVSDIVIIMPTGFSF
jgi:hypothetical protein